jgi:hypothetical protein
MDETATAIMAACRQQGIDLEKYGSDLPKMVAEAEQKNLWAVGWFYHHMRHHHLCLRPPRSLVEHIGWDEERRTTSTPAMMAWAKPPSGLCPPLPARWPAPIEHAGCAPLWRQAIDG